MLRRCSPARSKPWLLLATAAPAGFGLYRWITQLVGGPRHDDFRDFYAAASLGVTQGWSALYDLDLQRQTAVRLGIGEGWMPYFNPPPMAWLIAPLTALPFRAAYAVWTALMALALVITWAAIAPRRDRWTAASHLVAALGLYAVTFSLALGQVVPLVAAGVALAARLLERKQTVMAGLMLVLIDLKPQAAFLVPLALLCSGAGLSFLAWLVPTLALVGVSAAQLGTQGVARYADVLVGASALDQPSLRLDSLAPIGHPLAYFPAVAAALVALGTAYRLRHIPGVPVAAGILGSLLAAPHLNLQDLTLLVVAGWAIWPAQLAITRARWVGIGWVAVELGIGTGIPAVLFELAALSRLAWDGFRRR